MTQYAILTDLNRCVGCLGCSVACKVVNGVEIGSFWNKVLRIGPFPDSEGAQFPDVYTYFLPVTCQHCENPACVKVCPTGASQKLADGTVQIDKEKCIGCQFCAWLPLRRALPERDRARRGEVHAYEQKIAQGELPQCVAQCGARARYFGDLEQGLDSFVGAGKVSIAEDAGYDEVLSKFCTYGEIAKPYTDSDVHHLPNVGNDPSFLYILRNHEWKGEE
ncbi:MAG: 4Fe-4S dicluster domain-containing protein [Coriobacteriaceae bacterium]